MGLVENIHVFLDGKGPFVHAIYANIALPSCDFRVAPFCWERGDKVNVTAKGGPQGDPSLSDGRIDP
jgi:hypothetical protein